MRKLVTSIALLLTACLNVQCQKAEVHKNDGSVVEIPVDEILSIAKNEGKTLLSYPRLL